MGESCIRPSRSAVQKTCAVAVMSERRRRSDAAIVRSMASGWNAERSTFAPAGRRPRGHPSCRGVACECESAREAMIDTGRRIETSRGGSCKLVRGAAVVGKNSVKQGFRAANVPAGAGSNGSWGRARLSRRELRSRRPGAAVRRPGFRGKRSFHPPGIRCMFGHGIRRVARPHRFFVRRRCRHPGGARRPRQGAWLPQPWHYRYGRPGWHRQVRDRGLGQLEESGVSASCSPRRRALSGVRATPAADHWSRTQRQPGTGRSNGTAKQAIKRQGNWTTRSTDIAKYEVKLSTSWTDGSIRTDAKTNAPLRWVPDRTPRTDR